MIGSQARPEHPQEEIDQGRRRSLRPAQTVDRLRREILVEERWSDHHQAERYDCAMSNAEASGVSSDAAEPCIGNGVDRAAERREFRERRSSAPMTRAAPGKRAHCDSHARAAAATPSAVRLRAEVASTSERQEQVLFNLYRKCPEVYCLLRHAAVVGMYQRLAFPSSHRHDDDCIGREDGKKRRTVVCSHCFGW
jgi:hypothetical protein